MTPQPQQKEEQQRVSPMDIFLYQNAMQGNGNALFGAFLGQRLKSYLQNRKDVDSDEDQTFSNAPTNLEQWYAQNPSVFGGMTPQSVQDRYMQGLSDNNNPYIQNPVLKL